MQMILAPAWKRTADIVRSDLIFVPVALAYLFLLLHSWQPDTLALILPGNLEAGLSGQASAELHTDDTPQRDKGDVRHGE